MKKQKLPDHIDRNRRNYTAKGMTYTARRSGHSLEGEVLTLAVRGTLAKHKGVFSNFAAHVEKFCTGAENGKPVYKLRLSAVGKTYYKQQKNIPFTIGCFYSFNPVGKGKPYQLRECGRLGKLIESHATRADAREALERLTQEPQQ